MSAASRNPGEAPGRATAWNPTLPNQIRLAVYWFGLGFQEAALLTILLPLALSRLAPSRETADLARLATMAAAVRLLCLPLAGLYSDRVRARGGSRKPLLLAGAGVDAVGLVLLLDAADLGRFAAGFWLATLGESASLAAYQAFWPERVPPAVRGAASGYAGAASLLGTVAGLASAALLGERPALEWMLVLILLGAFVTWSGVQEAEPEAATAPAESESAAGLRHDFRVTWLGRFLVMLGVDLLMFFVFGYFQEVVGLASPSRGTASAAVVAVLAAAASSLLLGSCSDRRERKRLLALAGLPMALAAAGLALLPAPRWLPLFALAFGVGLGAFLAVDWALGVDTLPERLHLARDLGFWGLAANLPLLLAPALGGSLLALGGADPAAGYRLLFLASSLFLAAGSLVVLRVGARPLSPLRWLPVRLLAAAVVPAYLFLTCRVAVEGRLPRRRGATLVIANHQHDLDSLVVAGHLMRAGPWRDPVFSAGSERMFEPGFLAGRAPWWLEPLLRRSDWSRLFRALGIRPIENQPLGRPLLSLALEVMRRHGPLPLGEVFRPRVLERLAERSGLPPAELRGRGLDRLWTPRLFRAAMAESSPAALCEPFRSEAREATRRRIEAQMADLERLLRRGATLYLTPEGRFSPDGRLGRLRESLARLEPLAETTWVAAVSYDPYCGRRLGIFVRLRRVAAGEPAGLALAASRPVTATQLLADWLLEREAEQAAERRRRATEAGEAAGELPGAFAFTEAEALAGVEARLRRLPAGVVLAPALRGGPGRPVRAALRNMVQRGALRRQGGLYLRGPVRTHPRFPHVADMLAYQARQLAETVAANAELGAARLSG
ncbi:MAG: MFS transporter [Bacillota bacterium]|nr:MFS transporter [Bacillota bacterium]